MRSRPWLVIGLAAAVGATAARAASWPRPEALSPPPAAAPTPLRIAVEHPAPGASVTGERPVLVSGWALPPGSDRPRRDVVLVIDVSDSTSKHFRDVGEPASADAGDAPDALDVAPVAAASDAPVASVLEAELAAARRLLASLDPRFSRVAVISFSGEPLDERTIPERWRQLHPAADTWTGLTHDWAAVEQALEEVEAAGSHGLTHMAAGLERAVAELVGGPGASAEPDPRAERSILFMTDGVPTLPVPGDRWRNQAELLKQVTRAREYGIRIHSFAVGGEALTGPFTVETMAEQTGGTFTPVRDPATLPDKLPVVPLSGLEELRVENLTSGSAALATNLRPDGTFDALVRLAPGDNRIRVEARASDGSRARHEFSMQRTSDGNNAEEALPEHLVKRRAELLAKAVEDIRESLVHRMEHERAEGDGDAARQRRQLELELERARAFGTPPPADD
jgi:hypothetical protein